MKKIFKILQWIFGILLSLIGLSLLFQSDILAGLFIITSGIFCISPLLNFTEKILKYRFMSWQKYSIIIVCFILGVISISNKNDIKSSNSQNLSSSSNKRVGKKGNKYFNFNGEQISPEVTYYIVEEELYDAPIKTQITQHIAVEGQFNKEDVKEVLDLAYQEAKKRAGFNYHNPATHYFIMVYTDENRAKSKSGNWVGLLSKIKDNDEDYKINEELIVQSQMPHVEKFGLSETVRMEVYKEIILVERKATNEAEKKYDLSKMQGTPQEIATVVGKYRSELEEKYKKAVAKKYKITTEQLNEIGKEGFVKGWASPKSN